MVTLVVFGAWGSPGAAEQFVLGGGLLVTAGCFVPALAAAAAAGMSVDGCSTADNSRLCRLLACLCVWVCVSCRLSCSTTLALSSWQTRQSSRHGTLRQSSTASSTPSTGAVALVGVGATVLLPASARRKQAAAHRGGVWRHTHTCSWSPIRHAGSTDILGSCFCNGRACCCRSGSGRMTYRELRRSDLLDALFALEREEDINRVSRYFRSAQQTRQHNMLAAGPRAAAGMQYACSGGMGPLCSCCPQLDTAADCRCALGALSQLTLFTPFCGAVAHALLQLRALLRGVLQVLGA